MKKFIGFFLLSCSINTLADINLRSKFAGVWSRDCANTNVDRIYRVNNLIGEDESTQKRTDGEILSKSKYNFQAVTEKKFKLNLTTSVFKEGKVIRTSKGEVIHEFVEDLKGINYNKTKLISSIIIQDNGEKLQVVKDGLIYSKQADGSMKETGATSIMERCLN
jgi:hypothetical protein